MAGYTLLRLAMCLGVIAISSATSWVNFTGKDFGATLGPSGMRIVQCKHGLFMYNRHDTWVGKSLEAYGEWSEQELVLFQQIVRKGDLVIEAGANIGAFTIPFANMVGRKGLVFAYEPQRHLSHILGANAALNGQRHIHVINAALGAPRTAAVAGSGGSALSGEEEGRRLIQVPVVNYSVDANFGGVSLLEDYSWTQPVPLTTIDRSLLRLLGDGGGHGGDCPSLIKVDVEGMEAAVLAGANRTIRRCRPILYVENNCVMTSARIIRTIASFGYTMYWDIEPYFTKGNYRNESQNIFPPNAFSINIVAAHPTSRFKFSTFVQIRNEPDGWLLSDYEIPVGRPLKEQRGVRLNQFGNATSCKR